MNKHKSAQEIQDEILNTLTPEQSLHLSGLLSGFILQLYKLSGYGRDRFRALIQYFDREVHDAEDRLNKKGYFSAPYGIEKARKFFKVIDAKL